MSTGYSIVYVRSHIAGGQYGGGSGLQHLQGPAEIKEESVWVFTVERNNKVTVYTKQEHTGQ